MPTRSPFSARRHPFPFERVNDREIRFMISGDKSFIIGSQPQLMMNSNILEFRNEATTQSVHAYLNDNSIIYNQSLRTNEGRIAKKKKEKGKESVHCKYVALHRVANIDQRQLIFPVWGNREPKRAKEANCLAFKILDYHTCINQRKAK